MRAHLRWAGWLLAAATGPLQAMGLAEAFDAARRFDAQYGAARHELASDRQALPIARAALRPSLQLTASAADVSGRRQFQNALNQDVRVPVDYVAPQASLQLRQPLFNIDALRRYDQAGVQAEAAELQFGARGHELADRLATAYLQVLLAQDNVGLAAAEVEALKAQLDRAQQRQLRGEGTRTEVAQGQAGLDVARVRQLEARTQSELARRSLRRVTGQEPPALRNLDPERPVAGLQSAQLADWIALGEARNVLVQHRRLAVELARLGVERGRAQHLPRVDLVASLSRNRNESLTSLNQSSTLRSYGVQLNLPLYAGGGTEAGVEQALADKARAEEELRAEREAMQLEIQRHFSAVAYGAEKIAAYRRAVESNAVAVEGATRAQAAGLGTLADVLDARAKRFLALRDLAQARYDLLAAKLKLLMQSGLPAAEAVAEIDRELTLETPLGAANTP